MIQVNAFQQYLVFDKLERDIYPGATEIAEGKKSYLNERISQKLIQFLVFDTYGEQEIVLSVLKKLERFQEYLKVQYVSFYVLLIIFEATLLTQGLFKISISSEEEGSKRFGWELAEREQKFFFPDDSYWNEFTSEERKTVFEAIQANYQQILSLCGLTQNVVATSQIVNKSFIERVLDKNVKELSGDQEKEALKILEETMGLLEKQDPFTQNTHVFWYGHMDSFSKLTVELIGNDFIQMPYVHILLTNQFFIQEEIVPYSSISEMQVAFSMIVGEALNNMTEFSEKVREFSTSGEGIFSSEDLGSQIQGLKNDSEFDEVEITQCNTDFYITLEKDK